MISFDRTNLTRFLPIKPNLAKQASSDTSGGHIDHLNHCRSESETGYPDSTHSQYNPKTLAQPVVENIDLSPNKERASSKNAVQVELQANEPTAEEEAAALPVKPVYFQPAPKGEILRMTIDFRRTFKRFSKKLEKLEISLPDKGKEERPTFFFGEKQQKTQQSGSQLPQLDDLLVARTSRDFWQHLRQENPILNLPTQVCQDTRILTRKGDRIQRAIQLLEGSDANKVTPQQQKRKRKMRESQQPIKCGYQSIPKSSFRIIKYLKKTEGLTTAAEAAAKQERKFGLMYKCNGCHQIYKSSYNLRSHERKCQIEQEYNPDNFPSLLQTTTPKFRRVKAQGFTAAKALTPTAQREKKLADTASQRSAVGAS